MTTPVTFTCAAPPPPKGAFLDNAPLPYNPTGVYTLAFAPNPPTSLHLYRNGVRQSMAQDFTLNGNVVTFGPGVETPGVLDVLLYDLRY
jgi:hypothetical protein